MARKRGGLLLLFGAIIGAIAALFFSTNEEGETKESVKKKVKELKIQLQEAKEKDVVKKIFGAKSDELVDLFRETKEDLVKRLAGLKGSLDNIDKQKYLDVVNEVVEDLRKNTSVDSNQLSKLKKYLVDDYKKLEKPAKKVVKEA